MTPSYGLVSRYLTALASNDSARILSCFAPQATIVSPTYGLMDARAFYQKLCADTRSVEILVHGIHPSESDPEVCVAYFDYDWVLTDGAQRSLAILDLFRIQDERIVSLRIFADSRRDK